jgi:hypothetical protein
VTGTIFACTAISVGSTGTRSCVAGARPRASAPAPTPARPARRPFRARSSWAINNYPAEDQLFRNLGLFHNCAWSVEDSTYLCTRSGDDAETGSAAPNGVCGPTANDQFTALAKTSSTFADVDPLHRDACRLVKAAAAFCVATLVVALVTTTLAALALFAPKGGRCSGWTGLVLALVAFGISLVSLAAFGSAISKNNEIVHVTGGTEDAKLKMDAGFAVELLGGSLTLIGGLLLKLAHEVSEEVPKE